jgi:plastocyanin
MRWLAFVVCAWLVVSVTGLVLAAGSDAGVAVQLFKFRPDKLDVKAGTRVTWTNQDDIAHTVTSGTPDKPDRAFDFRLAGKGAAGSFEFSRAGAFPFYCERHQAMRGEIRVTQ